VFLYAFSQVRDLQYWPKSLTFVVWISLIDLTAMAEYALHDKTCFFPKAIYLTHSSFGRSYERRMQLD
jgi:hypothetical protein